MPYRRCTLIPIGVVLTCYLTLASPAPPPFVVCPFTTFTVVIPLLRPYSPLPPPPHTPPYPDGVTFTHGCWLRSLFTPPRSRRTVYRHGCLFGIAPTRLPLLPVVTCHVACLRLVAHHRLHVAGYQLYYGYTPAPTPATVTFPHVYSVAATHRLRTVTLCCIPVCLVGFPVHPHGCCYSLHCGFIDVGAAPHTLHCDYPGYLYPCVYAAVDLPHTVTRCYRLYG